MFFSRFIDDVSVILTKLTSYRMKEDIESYNIRHTSVDILLLRRRC
jgi:hypothetical protein